MDEHEWLAQRFEEHRTHLRAVAYRMLGSLSEADDAVQEAWLRLSRSDSDEIENLGGWLTTVVARISLNVLRTRRVRREEPLDTVAMPEPIISHRDGMDPEHEALLADSVGLALLVVLETLSPPSGSPSSCTTCSPSPSTRSARWSAARRPRRASSPAAAGAGCRARRPRPTPTSCVSANPDGRPFSVIGFTVAGGRIVEIDALSDPERLRGLDLTVLDD